MIKNFGLKKKDFILDIACNDGTFLENFTKKKFTNVVGVEPAKNLKNLNTKKKVQINTFFFDYKKSFILKKKYQKFKLITANNVCAHIPDVDNFFKGVKNILSTNGVFVFEVSYLLDVINKLTFDTIYHEHMSYHSLKPLIKFAKRNNLQVFDFDLISAQGGSIRVYVSHEKKFNVKEKKISNQILLERKKGLFSENLFKRYMKRINNQSDQLNKILNKFKKQKKNIIGFGAPAKLTTFSYKFNINNRIVPFVVDDNYLKQNRYSPGKHIKIISYEELKRKKFDAIIIFAWNFAESIIKRIKKDYKNKKIIVPFPKVSVTNS
jgi:SAM-dependent methyltransferase